MILNRDQVSIVLVEPEVQGNIGAAARSMKNTFFINLIVVGTSFFDDDAFARAKEASDILGSAEYYSDLKEVRENFDVLVGTSAVSSENMRDYRRIPMKPSVFWSDHYRNEKKTAIVIGREGDGLKNSELELCDFFITIPGNPDYPVYNLSHALTLILYESMLNEEVDYPEKDRASREEIEILLENINKIMGKVNFPAHKIPNTMVMFRRLISRSDMARSEFYRIMGIMRKIEIASRDMRNEKDGSS